MARRRNRHVLVVPYPAQGHVIPLMELSQRLAKQGFRITFVNTDFNHERVVASFSGKNLNPDQVGVIRLVSVPDGLGAGEDRNHLESLAKALSIVMPLKLKELIQKIDDESDDDNDAVTCVIADLAMPWALGVAEELGIGRVCFCSSSASMLVSVFSLQKLIDNGVMDTDGTPIDKGTNQFSALTPALDSKNFLWTLMGNACSQSFFVEVLHNLNKFAANLEWILCNSAYDLESGAFSLAPNIQPIGPLVIDYQPENSAMSFWPEDMKCLKWLDRQPPRSVIYVAFGSLTILQQNLFQELALGLELSNKPFLWVVRPDITEGLHESFPQGFQERVAGRAQLVGWAPQQKVLGHESIACFISHCGWNSTLEGLSNEVPFLCLPFCADQFTNESYICDVWKIGLRLEKDQTGIISKQEIKRKLDELLCGDQGFRGRARELKETAHNSVKEGGLSDQNFQAFTKWLRHWKASTT